MPGSQLHPDEEGDSRDDEKAAEERATGPIKGASSDADNSSPHGAEVPTIHYEMILSDPVIAWLPAERPALGPGVRPVSLQLCCVYKIG